MINRELVLDVFRKAQQGLVTQSSDLSLGTLSSMASEIGDNSAPINLAPEFQRRDRWSIDKQSALIESFLLNIPVPPIYLSEDEYGKYSVVDGKQRLTAISNFMTGNLRLKNLENFKGLEGALLNDLPEDMQNALRIRPFVRVITILKQSDADQKLEVFTRLNKGGEDMLEQEIRKVAFRGDLSNAIYKTAEESELLRGYLKIENNTSPAYRKMEDAEYILRYLSLKNSWNEFNGDLKETMNSYMKKNYKKDPEFIEAEISNFESTIEICSKIWQGSAFQRYNTATWRDQFIGGVYDAEMIAVNSINDDTQANAILHSNEIIEKTRLAFVNDTHFDKTVRLSTNTPSYLKYRVEKIIEILNEYQ